jgi:DEAD/DEAH box helicase domain-containing protein
MLMCDPWPLDQHYAKYPMELYTKPDAELSLDLDNEIVLEGHLQCAAHEMPIDPKEDQAYFGANLPELCRMKLVGDDAGFYHCHVRYKPFPSRHVTIRNTEDEHYTVIDITDGRYRVLEETEFSRAIFEVYEGAIFMHQGRTFLVKEVNHDQRLAKVYAANVDWSTKQRDYTDIDAVEAYRIREIKDSNCFACYGSVRITSIVYGYFKVDRRNNILDVVDIDTPPFIRGSHGVWLDVPQFALDILSIKNINVAASIHAAEHALLSLTPMFAMSVSGDVRTECKPPEKEFARSKSKRVRPARCVRQQLVNRYPPLVVQVDALRCVGEERRRLRQGL